MGQKSQSRWDKQNRKIAELEAELDRAYQFIEQLRQHNAQLQNRVFYLENNHSQQSSLLKNDLPRLLPASVRHQDRKASGLLSRRRMLKSISTKRLRLRVAVMAIAVIACFSSIGLGVNYLRNQRPLQLPAQPAATFPKLPQNIPSIPLVLPTSFKTLSQPIVSRQSEPENSEIIYNLKTPPNFKQSEKLQAIVDEVVSVASNKGMPTQALSITLIDAKTGEIAGYQQNELRYPASVVKLFWMVVLYAKLENGILTNEDKFNEYVSQMIQDSDNDAASFIVDQITDTKSQPELNQEEFKTWLNKREQVNHFFQEAGYERLNINQKAFPVYSINLLEPQGTDLQMRGNSQTPMRNQITTNHAARLIYEICYTQQAISSKSSAKMCEWLKRDLKPEVWKNYPGGFNPVLGLLGESLADADVHLHSKAGGTSKMRYEAAFVATNDGETMYVLAIAGDDPAYASDYAIFPKMSRLVFNRMTERF